MALGFPNPRRAGAMPGLADPMKQGAMAQTTGYQSAPPPRPMASNLGMSAAPPGAQTLGAPAPSNQYAPNVGMAQPSAMGPQGGSYDSTTIPSTSAMQPTSGGNQYLGTAPTAPMQPMAHPPIAPTALQPTAGTQPYTNQAPMAATPSNPPPVGTRARAEWEQSMTPQQRAEFQQTEIYGPDWRNDPGRVADFNTSQGMAAMDDQWTAQKNADRAANPAKYAAQEAAMRARVSAAHPEMAGMTDKARQATGGASAMGAAPQAAMSRGATNLGMGGSGPSGLAPTQVNPYLMQQGQAITDQVKKNLAQNLSGIQSNAVASGGLGGSRQGLAQAESITGASGQLAGALGNLYGGAFENQANRDLSQYQGNQANATQRYGIDTGAATSRYSTDANSRLGFAGLQNQMGIAQMGNETNRYGMGLNYDLGMTNAGNQRYATDQNYQLGMTNAGNQRYGMDQSYNLGMTNANNNLTLGQGQLDNSRLGIQTGYDTAQRGLDQSGARLGMDMFNMGVNGPWNPINNATNAAQPYTGSGTTTNNTGSSGGGVQGAIGGGLSFAAFAKQMGWI